MTFEQMWRDLAPVGRSASSGGYFRQPWGSAESELRAWFTEQATVRGLRLSTDPLGNQVAWWDPEPGAAAADGGAGRRDGVLTGSHLDSVLDGGAYDGPLGVVSALAALDLLRERGFAPGRPLGVSVFVEEEGSRFGRSCFGSRVATGMTTWQQARELRDRDGVALPDALSEAGLDPTALESESAGGARGTGLLDDVGCYLELHVEQGRELIDRDAAVGLASVIWPHGRWRFDFTGEANHAGTTRMEDRRDPMLTYAMTVLAANKQARSADLRATFGRIEAHPGTINAVASQITAWLDARGADEDAVTEMVATIERQAHERAERDGTGVVVTAESITDPVAFDPDLAARLADGRDWPVIPSGAGHDAGILTQAGIPSAMLFVRNPTGVSHSPAEHAETADCLAGVETLADSLERLAR